MGKGGVWPRKAGLLASYPVASFLPLATLALIPACAAVCTLSRAVVEEHINGLSSILHCVSLNRTPMSNTTNHPVIFFLLMNYPEILHANCFTPIALSDEHKPVMTVSLPLFLLLDVSPIMKTLRKTKSMIQLQGLIIV